MPRGKIVYWLCANRILRDQPYITVPATGNYVTSRENDLLLVQSVSRYVLILNLPSINSVRNIMTDQWKCIICSFVLSLSQLLSHLNNIHCNDIHFRQKWGLPGCLSKTDYTSTNSLIKHVRTSHHALLNCKYKTVRKG